MMPWLSYTTLSMNYKKTNKQKKIKYEAPIGKIICLHQVTVVIIINALVTSSKSGQIN